MSHIGRIPPLPQKGTPTFYELKLVTDLDASALSPTLSRERERERTLSQNRSMIETRARVVSAAHGKVWVEASSQQGCAACQSHASCGVSGLGKFLGRNKPPVALACDLAVRPGDRLVLNITESDLLRAGLLAYLLPALLSVLGALTATHFELGDAAAAAAMVAGFAAGLVVARVFARAPHIRISRPTDSPTPGDPHD